LSLVVEELGGKQQQGGPDSLAAPGAQVFSDFRNGLDTRNRIPAEFVFQSDEVVAEEIENLFSVNRSGRAQVGPQNWTSDLGPQTLNSPFADA
jgi:hypothetical protein